MPMDDLRLFSPRCGYDSNKGFHQLDFHMKEISGGTWKKEAPGIQNVLCYSVLFSDISVTFDF